MQLEKLSVTITTDGSGDATGYIEGGPGGLTGRVLMFQYTKSDYADGVDMTVTVSGTTQAIITLTDQNSSAIFYPRQQVHGATGTGLTMDGTRLLVEPVPVVNDRIKIVVAQGGATKSGTFTAIIG